MDEQHGRARADHFEIPCIGVIGVFIEAKDNGHIQAVRPHLDALREEAGFHIGDPLYIIGWSARRACSTDSRRCLAVLQRPLLVVEERAGHALFETLSGYGGC
ncbi:DUF3368 domain-containing protein [Salinibacter ruber]|uniref:DUF3368 domain-containing protein n=1 Tax=Salinibacter ruber TaxID=146919 RepID=UPI002072AAE7|nr:DUF3368 domain-containing protein [Salinibacter ruber]